MGNAIDSFFSGFGKDFSEALRSPIDFIKGKHCNCGATWDIICYVEHLCVTNLLKTAMICALFYFACLFMYMLCKTGIYNTIFHGISKMVRGFIRCWFSLWENYCICLCNCLIIPLTRCHRRKRQRRLEDLETSNDEEEEEEEDGSYSSDVSRRSRRASREYSKRVYLKKSLKPRNYRVSVEVGSYRGGSSRKFSEDEDGDYGGLSGSVRISHSSKFVRKGRSVKRSKRL